MDTTTIDTKIDAVITEKQSFHRRELKPPGIAFSSDEGKALFRASLADGNAEIFFPLFESYNTQSAPAYCGLTSLSVAMNALLIDPQRIWQGNWRWFSEELLDCCDPLEVIKLKGITLKKLYCLSRCQGARSTMTYGPEITLDSFRELVRKSCSIENGEKSIIIAHYSRKSLNQTGSGHFSPLGAYHEERDMVLILDTARFKLPPHWVPLPSLYDAMLVVDKETNKPRGLLTIQASSALYENCCAACVEEEKEKSEERHSESAGGSTGGDMEEALEIEKRKAAMRACTKSICAQLSVAEGGEEGVGVAVGGGGLCSAKACNNIS